MSCNPHRDVREHIPTVQQCSPQVCATAPTLTTLCPLNYTHTHAHMHACTHTHLLFISLDSLRSHDCRSETAQRVWMRGPEEVHHIQIYISSLREINNFSMRKKSELCDLIFQPQYLLVPLCHTAKCPVEPGTLHSDRRRVSVCDCVCVRGEKCMLKRWQEQRLKAGMWS